MAADAIALFDLSNDLEHGNILKTLVDGSRELRQLPAPPAACNA